MLRVPVHPSPKQELDGWAGQAPACVTGRHSAGSGKSVASKALRGTKGDARARSQGHGAGRSSAAAGCSPQPPRQTLLLMSSAAVARTFARSLKLRPPRAPPEAPSLPSAA
eukprot:CAMPEP_0202110280 /NCGR_PEP_ID=MMETSP0965-20130614/26198_1 /ASSEMBLY_ACC=CAM_ASM_000507 /TAXON_ID=4773 /ORGANISM="Schizochytrium aggregatum, Strain ATCC28209" /LENGTH=110 /DNA_ID=CAMNT_0048679687 /DNA_START=189 /DNA_END=517 /DNA_ORIENTATION=-